MEPTDQDEIIRENAAEYGRQKTLLDEAYEKERIYRDVEQEITLETHSLQQLSAQYEADIKRMQMLRKALILKSIARKPAARTEPAESAYTTSGR